MDDETLVNTLQTSKATSAQVSEQLEVAEQTEQKIDKAREAYRSSSQRASILFFVLNDMGHIDPMYQFSLDAYIDLFQFSIDKSPRSPKIDDRIQNLNDFHTYAVYKYKDSSVCNFIIHNFEYICELIRNFLNLLSFLHTK